MADTNSITVLEISPVLQEIKTILDIARNNVARQVNRY